MTRCGDTSGIVNTIETAAADIRIIDLRMSLAGYTADTFMRVGTTLHAFGRVLGPDRKSGASPFGHGDDSAVAVSVLLRIGSQLISGSADLFASKRHYAASALVRQLVEIEYLAWAFETNNDDSARWLRSTREERMIFFTPAKLRKAADGHFRGVDYGYHCELGGHPTPDSWRLLIGEPSMAQLMLADCLGHAGRIWDHVTRWATRNALVGIVASEANAMSGRYRAWKQVDPLAALPPPPG